jgi:hypothetical protein
MEYMQSRVEKRYEMTMTKMRDYGTPERRLSEMNPTYSLLMRAGMMMITRPLQHGLQIH